MPKPRPLRIVLLSDNNKCLLCCSKLQLRKDRPATILVYDDQMGTLPGKLCLHTVYIVLISCFIHLLMQALTFTSTASMHCVASLSIMDTTLLEGIHLTYFSRKTGTRFHFLFRLERQRFQCHCNGGAN